jgi:hypothetical protein
LQKELNFEALIKRGKVYKGGIEGDINGRAKWRDMEGECAGFLPSLQVKKCRSTLSFFI